MGEMLIRFVLGGTIVSVFALLGDLLRPKGFAGLFAAAPSVALATLSLAAFTRGTGYALTEARSMLFGEVALLIYAVGCVYFLAIRHYKAAPTATAMVVVWGIVATCLYLGLLQRW